jgi:septin family protein
MVRKKISDITKDELLLETMFKCSICENESTLEYHHIKFVSEGGNNAKENLIVLCPNCHSHVHKRKINPDLLKRIKEHWISRRFLGIEELRWVDYLTEKIDEYEKDEALKYYIDLEGVDENDVYSGKLGDIVNDFLFDIKNVLVILGDYGTGKTTFLKKIFSQKAEAYLNDPINNRIPILIYLRDYQKATSIGSLIEDYLRDFGLEYNSFRKFVREGRILLLLDGFDEMSGDMRRVVSFQNMQEINKLFSEKVKLILTSRTHYFKERKDEREILYLDDFNKTGFILEEVKKVKIFYIMEFTEKKVEQYLRLFYKDEWRAYKKKIQNIYDLKSLSKRPILLNLIAKILPELDKPTGSITQDTLYEIYIDVWFKREIKDKKRDINKNAVIIFLEELAFEMFNTRRNLIYYSEVEKRVMRHFDDKILSSVDLEDISGRIRTSTFLIRDQYDKYFFAHRSFMEYFVSKRVLREIRSGMVSILTTKYLTDEIRNFIAQQLDTEDIERLFKFINTTNSTIARINISDILGKTTDYKIVLRETHRLAKGYREVDKLNASIIYHSISKNLPEVIPLSDIFRLIRDESKSVQLYSSLTLGKVFEKQPQKFKGLVVGKKEYKCKIVVIGDANVGKTALIGQLIHKEFRKAYIETIGVKVSRKDEIFLRLSDENKCEIINLSMQIWDILGDHDFIDSIGKKSFFKADGAIFVCDITQKKIVRFHRYLA